MKICARCYSGECKCQKKQEAVMHRKLTSHGGTKCLCLPKPILELLQFKQEKPLLIRTDGKRLIIEQCEGCEECKDVEGKCFNCSYNLDVVYKYCNECAKKQHDVEGVEP